MDWVMLEVMPWVVAGLGVLLVVEVAWVVWRERG